MISPYTPPRQTAGAPWLLRPTRLDLYISPGAVAEIIAELHTMPHHHLRRQHEKGQQVHGCRRGDMQQTRTHTDLFD